MVTDTRGRCFATTPLAKTTDNQLQTYHISLHCVEIWTPQQRQPHTDMHSTIRYQIHTMHTLLYHKAMSIYEQVLAV